MRGNLLVFLPDLLRDLRQHASFQVHQHEQALLFRFEDRALVRVLGRVRDGSLLVPQPKCIEGRSKSILNTRF